MAAPSASFAMSHDDDKLDFNKLQRELDAAVAMDAKYWRENDAKIRAVTEQKVATYDEFKDLVAASHLKPLDKGLHLDNIGGNTKQLWNSAAARHEPQTDVPRTQAQPAQEGMKVPKSGQEFARDWQRHYKTAEQRYTYLLNTGAPQLRHIFKTEVSFGLLGDILAALMAFPVEDASTVLDILDSLQASSRFSLSLQFLSKKEKDVFKFLEY
nr:hypothetical protein BaRGS_024338 [Batillaria attramentaria]